MSLDIGDLTIGVSGGGMSQYREDIKMELLKTTQDKVNDVEKVLNTIAAGWTGISHDRFVAQFQQVRETINAALEKEYQDLENRLIELEGFYYKQDQDMIQE